MNAAVSGPRPGPGWRAYLFLTLLALALYLPGRAGLPPIDRDEARYMQSTRQMLASGDWIDIRFQDQPRNLQPAGVYWLEAASVKLLANGDARAVWAYRVPSLLAGVVATLVTLSLATMLFGPAAGVGAAVLLASCALLGFEARIAKIDACLLAAVLVAQRALIAAYLGRIKGAGRLNALAFWAAVGVGLLLKGPIVLIVSGLTTLTLVVADRRAGWLKRLHAGWGAPLALAIAAPWFVAIGLRTHGAFYDKAVRQNLLGKIGRGEQHHGQPPGYYLLLASLTFWPAALAAVFAAPWAWASRRAPEVRALLAWLVPTWVLYEVVGTKLPHYVLPLYPALACMAAGAAVAPGGWRAGRAARGAAWVYGAVWLAASLAFAFGGAWLVWRFDHRLDLLALGAGVVVLALAIAVLWFVWEGARGPALAAGAAAAVATYAVLYGHVLPSLTPVWLGRRIATEAQAVRPCPSSELISTRFSEPSLVFAYDGAVRLVAPPAAAALMSRDRACAVVMVGADQVAAFRAAATGDGLDLRVVGGTSGFDYSTGRARALTLFAAAAIPQAPVTGEPVMTEPGTARRPR